MRAVIRFLRCEDGATTAEYAVAVGLVVASIAGVIGVMNTGAGQTFSGVGNTVGTYGS